MTKMMLAVLALALVIALPAVAQDATQQNPSMNQSPDQNTTQPSTQANPSMAQPPDQNSTQPAQQSGNSQGAQSSQSAGSNATSMGPDSQVGQTMTGTISADGKTFNSNGTSYTISNPNSVKPYANQPITVGYDMDTNNSIRITKVMLTKPQH